MRIKKLSVHYFVFLLTFFQLGYTNPAFSYYPNYPRQADVSEKVGIHPLTLSSLILNQSEDFSFLFACKKLRQARLLFVQKNLELAMQDVHHALILNNYPEIQIEALLLARQIAFQMNEDSLDRFQESLKNFPGLYNLLKLEKQQVDSDFFKKYKEAFKIYRRGNKSTLDEFIPKNILLVSPQSYEDTVNRFFEAAEGLSFFESIRWISTEEYTKDSIHHVDLIILICCEDAFAQKLIPLKTPICFVGSKPKLIRGSDIYVGIDRAKMFLHFNETFMVQPDDHAFWILSEEYQDDWKDLCQKNKYFESQHVHFIRSSLDLGQQLEEIFAVPHRKRYFQELLGPKINYLAQAAIFPQRMIILLPANQIRLVSAFVHAHAQHQVELYALDKVISNNKILDKPMIGAFVFHQQDLNSVETHLIDLPAMIPFLSLLRSEKSFVYHGRDLDYSYDQGCVAPLIHYKNFT